jgi:hypothetical protein
MNRIIYISLLATLLPLIGNSQIFGNDITGPDPGLSNPFTNGQYFDANVTVSGISRGPGVPGNVADDRYNGRGWNSMVLDNTDYFEFTISPSSSYKLNFTSFVYNSQASGTGPNSFSFRSSLDGFSSEIASPGESGGTIDLTGATFQNISSPITFRLYAWGGSSAQGTFSINDFEFQGSVPLPIELIKFSGKEDDGQVLLNWTTASELNSDFISIERSKNNEDFAEIGRVAAQGTSFNTTDYDFLDFSPNNGTNYYRLKETSLDGKETLHPVIAVEVAGLNNLFKVYPSHPSEMLFIDSGAFQVDKISIISLAGNVEIQLQINTEGTTPINVSHLSKGIYFLIVEEETGMLQSFKFVRP